MAAVRKLNILPSVHTEKTAMGETRTDLLEKVGATNTKHSIHMEAYF